MSDDPTQDAHSLGIALRLAHAQNRDLRKQLAASTSNGSLKFQDGICSDCESPDLCIQDNGCHNSGKIFSLNDRPTCEKADSTSETPRSEAFAKYWESSDMQRMAIRLLAELERELAQAIKERDEAIVEMEKCNDLSERAVKEAEKWNKSAMEQNTSLHREIALRIIAEQQLATAKEALDNADDELRFAEDTIKGREGDAITKVRGILQQALVAIKPNQGEQP